MNEENWKRFAAAYETGLMKAVTEHRAYYVYGPAGVPDVARKMLLAIKSAETVKVVGFTADGFKNACRALGIKHTAKAMDAFLRGE